MTGYAGKIEEETLDNAYFRQVIFTGKYSQLVLMSLKPGEEIGLETHDTIDQFFRVEQGQGKFIIGDEEHVLGDGEAAVIPAGSKHNVINVSETEDLKLYTIYSPPEHPEGTIHKTKEEAVEHEH